MKSHSLRQRFINNTAIVVALVMLVSVLVVDLSYVHELEKSAQEKLRLHIYTLLSVAQFEGNGVTVPVILYNAQFNTADSGLWAVVLDSKRQPLWHSLSAPDIPPGLALATDTGAWQFGNAQVGQHKYFTVAYRIAWEQDGQRYDFHFVVAEDEAALTSEIHQFRLRLLAGFCLITLSLLLCQYLVLTLAFRPIRHLEQEIAALETGHANTLSADYPRELRGVARNLNALIDKEHRQRERYRASMADLAHSLKTPMTLIRGELKHIPHNKTMLDAIARIDNSIEYQLRRAVISGHALLSQGTQVDEVLQLVVEAMEKIYVERHIQLHTDTSQQLFYGDENDLMEIFGNLLDNAYKHANSIVQVSIASADGQLTFTIEDDGPGFSTADSEKIFGRGERLDRQGLGQGIGLAVVYDIVNSYGGQIAATRSRLGGAKFNIVLPEKGRSE